MQVLDQLGVALGLATLAGVNLYLTVLLTGLAIRFNFLDLAAHYQNLEMLGHPIVLAVAGVLFVVEFVADKVPWVDSLWDTVHTLIRPVGGVLLSIQALGEMEPYMQVVAGLLAGGAALTTHSAKAGTRLLINHSPEPASNVTMSVTEDVAVAGGVALTLLHPAIALAVFSAILFILWLIFPRMWRAARATLWLAWNKLKMPGRRQPLVEPVALSKNISLELRDLLLMKAALSEDAVLSTVPCLSGKAKGLKGLSGNLEGILVVTKDREALYFAAIKGLRHRLFKMPLVNAVARTESKFLSENLLVESPVYRAVFRFPRGEGDTAETLVTVIKPDVETAVVSDVLASPQTYDPAPDHYPESAPASEPEAPDPTQHAEEPAHGEPVYSNAQLAGAEPMDAEFTHENAEPEAETVKAEAPKEAELAPLPAIR